MNFIPMEPCAVIKGTRWLKYNIHLIWECASHCRALRCRHHNSPGPRIEGDIAMFPVEFSNHITMWLLGLVVISHHTRPAAVIQVVRKVHLDCI